MYRQDDGLSVDELRNRLYHSLRERGLVDSLKSQLRNRLVCELNHKGSGFHDEGSKTLIQRVLNSLVADYMRRSQMGYSLSVFLPESQTSEENAISIKDILQMLGVHVDSKLHKSLLEKASDPTKDSFLWDLLTELSRARSATSRDLGVQAEILKTPLANDLNEKLNAVEKTYASRLENGSVLLEERFLSYQRNLDKQKQDELAVQMSDFREKELREMRREEREKLNDDLKRLRRDLENSYQQKLDALQERERHANDRVLRQSQIAEKETYSQRQTLLTEIEVVRQREEELHRQAHLYEREKTLLEEKMSAREDLVKRREDSVSKAEVDYERRLTDSLNTYKLEYETMYLQRSKDIELREAKVKDDEKRLKEELFDVKHVKDELRQKQIAVHSLEADLKSTQHELMVTRTQTAGLNDQIRGMGDYQTLKEECAAVRRELDATKTRNVELLKENAVERQKQESLLREMADRAERPSPEVALLQQELQLVRGQLRALQVQRDHEVTRAERDLAAEIDKSKKLVEQCESQTAQVKDMQREIDDLRSQLGQTQMALSHQVHGPLIDPAASNKRQQPEAARFRRRLFYFDDLTRQRTAYKRCSPTFDLTTMSDDDVDISSSSQCGDHRQLQSAGDFMTDADDPVSRSEDYSYASDIMKDTRDRLRKLEMEAENLEQNYRQFQFRMTSTSNVLPTDLKSGATTTPPRRADVPDWRRPLSSTPCKAAAAERSSVTTSPMKPAEISVVPVADSSPRNEESHNATISEPERLTLVGQEAKDKPETQATGAKSDLTDNLIASLPLDDIRRTLQSRQKAAKSVSLPVTLVEEHHQPNLGEKLGLLTTEMNLLPSSSALLLLNEDVSQGQTEPRIGMTSTTLLPSTLMTFDSSETQKSRTTSAKTSTKSSDGFCASSSDSNSSSTRSLVDFSSQSLQPPNQMMNVPSRPLNMSDLATREGEASVLHIQDSAVMATAVTTEIDPDTSSQSSSIVPGSRISPPGQSEPGSMPDRSGRSAALPDSVTDEDAAYEERMRQRAEERDAREKLEREEQARQLAELERGAATSMTSASPEQAEPEPAAESSGLKIDPSMAKYMEQLQAQRAKEKEVQQKVVDVFKKGKVIGGEQEKSQSESEKQGMETAFFAQSDEEDVDW